MIKISEIISREVIAIYECESVGTIKSVCFNQNLTKAIGFVFFNDENDFDSCINQENIYSITEEGILIRNMSKTSIFVGENNSPINKKIFSVTGKDYGKIKDVILNQDLTVDHFLTNKQTKIYPQNLVTFGSTILITNDNDNPVKAHMFKPKERAFVSEKELKDITVKILQISPTKSEQEPLTPIKFPLKINSSNQTKELIGKKVSKTIMGQNNEIIIRQNNIISGKTLDMAKRHNKTRELMFNVVE